LTGHYRPPLTFVRPRPGQLVGQPVEPGLFWRPCRASFVPGCIRSPAQTLLLLLDHLTDMSEGVFCELELTDAMGARVLAIAFCPQLVALITGSADSPPDRASGACHSGRGPVRVLPVFLLVPWPLHMRVVDRDVLLELLEGIVRPLGQAVEARGMHMGPWVAMAIGEKGVGGDGVVG